MECFSIDLRKILVFDLNDGFVVHVEGIEGLNNRGFELYGAGNTIPREPAMCVLYNKKSRIVLSNPAHNKLACLRGKELLAEILN